MGGTLSPKRSLFQWCFRPFRKGFFFVFFSPADEDLSVGDPPPEAEELSRPQPGSEAPSVPQPGAKVVSSSPNSNSAGEE
eukprot:1229096-Rhodomonas_salina.1